MYIKRKVFMRIFRGRRHMSVWVDELVMQLLSSRGIIVIIVIRTHREVSKNGLVRVERLQKL